MFRPLLKLGYQLGRTVLNQKHTMSGPLPPEIETGFNDQIAMEYLASFTYFSMAMNFGRQDMAYPGCYKFFFHQYEEEREHAEKFASYLLKRGNKVALKEIGPPAKKCWEAPLEAFKDALELEKVVTQKLLDLRKISREKGDLFACLFVENEFLEGQMEEYDALIRHVSQLERIGDDATGIFVFDRSLLKQKK